MLPFMPVSALGQAGSHLSGGYVQNCFSLSESQGWKGACMPPTAGCICSSLCLSSVNKLIFVPIASKK